MIVNKQTGGGSNGRIRIPAVPWQTLQVFPNNAANVAFGKVAFSVGHHDHAKTFFPTSDESASAKVCAAN